MQYKNLMTEYDKALQTNPEFAELTLLRVLRDCLLYTTEEMVKSFRGILKSRADALYDPNNKIEPRGEIYFFDDVVVTQRRTTTVAIFYKGVFIGEVIRHTGTTYIRWAHSFNFI